MMRPVSELPVVLEVLGTSCVMTRTAGGTVEPWEPMRFSFVPLARGSFTRWRNCVVDDSFRKGRDGFGCVSSICISATRDHVVGDSLGRREAELSVTMALTRMNQIGIRSGAQGIM